MKQVAPDNLSEMVEAIVREVDPEEIILFGSRARGTAGVYSDFDLLIIESEDFGPGHSRWNDMAKIYDIAARFRVPVDILLYSREEMSRWQDTPGHIAGKAAREGSAIYERH